MALRIFVPTSHSFGDSTGQTLAQSPQPVQLVFDIAGALVDIDFKIAHKAADAFHFAIGHQVDILILADRHHFRGTDTGRTVQSRKSLIILEHVPPDRRLPFHEYT